MVIVQYSHTKDVDDDVLTKPLSRVKFKHFRDKLGVVRKDLPWCCSGLQTLVYAMMEAMSTDCMAIRMQIGLEVYQTGKAHQVDDIVWDLL